MLIQPLLVERLPHARHRSRRWAPCYSHGDDGPVQEGQPNINQMYEYMLIGGSDLKQKVNQNKGEIQENLLEIK